MTDSKGYSSSEDGADVLELLRKVCVGWRRILGGAVVGLIASGVAVTLIAPRYEALALVQVAQVGQIALAPSPSQASQISSVQVEPATQAVERMRSPVFQLKVAEALGLAAWAADLRRTTSATKKNISLQVVKSTSVPGSLPLIELRTYASTPDSAKQIAEGLISELAKREGEMADLIIGKLRHDLEITKAKFFSVEQELDAIKKMMMNVGVRDDRFTQLSLITDLRVQKESEIFKLRQAILALETALAPPYTQQATVLEEVFVTDTPVSPKKILLLVLGLVGGALAGAVSIFLVNVGRASGNNAQGFRL